MNDLMRLGRLPTGFLTDDFRRGDPAVLDVTGYVQPAELDPRRVIDLRPLRAVVAAAMDRFPGEPAKSDPWLGPRVHATLRLTRREAADKGLWQYLTVAEFPGYVRWRWETADPDKPVPLDRFLGEDSKNALARLWWAAELTRDGSSYARSEVALSLSRFSVSWLHLIFTHHRAAALAAVDFLDGFQQSGATDPQGQAMAKAVNLALRTISLDSLADSPPTDADAVRDWILQPVDETLMAESLPVGPDEEPVPASAVTAVHRFLVDLASRIDLATVKSHKRVKF